MKELRSQTESEYYLILKWYLCYQPRLPFAEEILKNLIILLPNYNLDITCGKGQDPSILSQVLKFSKIILIQVLELQALSLKQFKFLKLYLHYKIGEFVSFNAPKIWCSFQILVLLDRVHKIFGDIIHDSSFWLDIVVFEHQSPCNYIFSNEKFCDLESVNLFGLWHLKLLEKNQDSPQQVKQYRIVTSTIIKWLRNNNFNFISKAESLVFTEGNISSRVFSQKQIGIFSGIQFAILQLIDADEESLLQTILNQINKSNKDSLMELIELALLVNNQVAIKFILLLDPELLIGPAIQLKYSEKQVKILEKYFIIEPYNLNIFLYFAIHRYTKINVIGLIALLKNKFASEVALDILSKNLPILMKFKEKVAFVDCQISEIKCNYNSCKGPSSELQLMNFLDCLFFEVKSNYHLITEEIIQNLLKLVKIFTRFGVLSSLIKSYKGYLSYSLQNFLIKNISKYFLLVDSILSILLDFGLKLSLKFHSDNTLRVSLLEFIFMNGTNELIEKSISNFEFDITVFESALNAAILGGREVSIIHDLVIIL